MRLKKHGIVLMAKHNSIKLFPHFSFNAVTGFPDSVTTLHISQIIELIPSVLQRNVARMKVWL